MSAIRLKSLPLAAFAACLLMQCQTDTKQPPAAPTEAAPSQSSPAQPATSSAAPYPSISDETMQNLYGKCDLIDFVFYGANFSMSQNEKAAIQTTLRGVSKTPAQVYPECKPIGRIFFQIQGQQAAEADIFFGGNCLYYLWVTDGQYTHGNQLTAEAAQFYNTIFRQVQQQQPNQ